MGIILSHFKRKPSTKQILEEIEKKLNNIDEFQQNTIERQNRIARKLLVIFVLVYILAITAFVLISSVQRYKFYYFSGLVIFALISWLSHKSIKWYFNRQMVSNSKKSIELKKKKKKILEEVMDTETYKVAKEILDRFGDKAQQSPLEMKPVQNPSSDLRLQGTPGTQLRQRHVEANRGVPPKNNTPAQAPIPANISNQLKLPQLPQNAHQPPRLLGASFNQPPARQLPRPILPRERGMVDRMMDFLVGDGPHQRYALICRHCSGHNGMALQEEFEYISFYCCYCFQFNPPRKMRPMGPRLPLAAPPSIPALPADTNKSGEIKELDDTKQPEASERSETEASDEISSSEDESASPEEVKTDDANQTSEKMDVDSNDNNKTISESIEEDTSSLR